MNQPDIDKIKKKIAIYDKKIARNIKNNEVSKNPKVYSLKSKQHEKLKEIDEALESLSKAIEIEPHNKLYLSNRMNLYMTNNQADKAGEDLDNLSKLLESNPDLGGFNGLMLSINLDEYQENLKLIDEEVTDPVIKELLKKRRADDSVKGIKSKHTDGSIRNEIQKDALKKQAFEEYETHMQTLNMSPEDLNTLQYYIDGFRSQCEQTYIASSMIDSGQINFEVPQSIGEKIAISLISYIPFCGAHLSKGVDYLSNNYKELKITESAKNVFNCQPTSHEFLDIMTYQLYKALKEGKHESILDGLEIKKASLTFLEQMGEFLKGESIGDDIEGGKDAVMDSIEILLEEAKAKGVEHVEAGFLDRIKSKMLKFAGIKQLDLPEEYLLGNTDAVTVIEQFIANGTFDENGQVLYFQMSRFDPIHQGLKDGMTFGYGVQDHQELKEPTLTYWESFVNFICCKKPSKEVKEDNLELPIVKKTKFVDHIKDNLLTKANDSIEEVKPTGNYDDYSEGLPT